MIVRTVLTFVTAANTIRFIGGSQRTVATYNGDLAVFHYLPGMGDALAGIGAIVLTILIARNGLTSDVRRYAWAWNIFGAIDLMIAMPVNVLFRPDDPRFFTPGLALPFLACHLAMMATLWRTRVATV